MIMSLAAFPTPSYASVAVRALGGLPWFRDYLSLRHALAGHQFWWLPRA